MQRERFVIDDLARILILAVLVVDGEVKVVGKVSSPEEIKRMPE